MATAATAKATSNRLKFIEYATETGTLVTTENFFVWDGEYNGGMELARLEEKYGKAEIYRIGILELFRRELYVVKFSIPKGSVSLPAGVPPTTVVQRGLVLTNKITGTQRDFLVEKATQEMKNAARRLKLFGLTPAKIVGLVEEALSQE